MSLEEMLRAGAVQREAAAAAGVRGELYAHLVHMNAACALHRRVACLLANERASLPPGEVEAGA